MRLLPLARGTTAPTSTLEQLYFEYPVVLAVMASSLYRLLGAKVAQGYETSNSKHIFRDLVNATGLVGIGENDITIQLHKRAHKPFLIAAGLQNTDVAVTWLGRKRLHVVLG